VLDILKIDKTLLIYSVLYLNLEKLIPSKPPVATGLILALFKNSWRV